MPAGRPPEWLRIKLRKHELSRETAEKLASFGVTTVCANARCPNIGECYGAGTATFLIMGRTCTRDCAFCAVAHGAPEALDPTEPERVAAAAAELSLRHVVITSVTRDDLPDGGAEHFASTIRAVRERLPIASIEVLTPDFAGNEEHIGRVTHARPDIYNHNLETVRRLQRSIRPSASYGVSLRTLAVAKAAANGIVTKSGLMLGLGETMDEVREAMRDLREAGCDLLTLGQYLRPTPTSADIARYVHPDEFEELRQEALSLGFAHCAAGPFVRSSYHAATAADIVKVGRVP